MMTAHSWCSSTDRGAVSRFLPGSPAAVAAAVASLNNSGSPRSSFTCSLCRECFRVDYYGRKPPFCPQLVFMEDVFCMKDPFSVGGGGGQEGGNRKCLPTVVGGTCAACSREVCAQCSFFYAVRFCGPCAREHRSRFPSELHRMIDATGLLPKNDVAAEHGVQTATSLIAGKPHPP